jgi:hypothetical protein
MKGKDEHIRKESNIFSSPNQKNLRWTGVKEKNKQYSNRLGK